MGFLDKQSRVIDFVLTERGRQLYATGELDFAYFSLFDDGIDYDPTDCDTQEEIEQQIQALPVLEAPFIKEKRAVRSPGEPISHLFNASPVYSSIPHLDSPSAGDELEIICKQELGPDGRFLRTSSTVAMIDVRVVGDREGVNPGFIVRTFTSGTNGVNEVAYRRDLAGRKVVDSFVAVSVDQEQIEPSAIERRNAAPSVNVPSLKSKR